MNIKLNLHTYPHTHYPSKEIEFYFHIRTQTNSDKYLKQLKSSRHVYGPHMDDWCFTHVIAAKIPIAS